MTRGVRAAGAGPSWRLAAAAARGGTGTVADAARSRDGCAATPRLIRRRDGGTATPPAGRARAAGGYGAANSAIRPSRPLRKRGESSVDICRASSTASVIATASSISST